MNTNSNSYVMVFAITMCVTVSSILAFLATSLKPLQEAAAEFDRQKNVMMAAGMIERGDLRPRVELEKLYQTRVQTLVIDTRDGSVAGKGVESLVSLDEKSRVVAVKRHGADPEAMLDEFEYSSPYRIIETAMTDDGKGSIDAYILPVSGKGLWSTLYGYLALDSDKNHVRGIQFYKHGETPGLGGEIENPDWTKLWVGKEILDASGKLVSITVKKGKVDASIPAEKAHAVDGLAGATITSNGVTKFVKRDLQAFSQFLNKK